MQACPSPCRFFQKIGVKKEGCAFACGKRRFARQGRVQSFAIGSLVKKPQIVQKYTAVTRCLSLPNVEQKVFNFCQINLLPSLTKIRQNDTFIPSGLQI
jgi:hypothetical protein